MLRNDFYKAGPIEQDAPGVYSCQIRLNKEHAIFKGHFPELAVMPGVTMVQVVKETCEAILQRSLLMKSSKMIKFLSMVRPEEHPDLVVEVVIKNDDTSWDVSGLLKNGETTFFKIKGTFHAAN
jgi:3-hydroxyacyl-[acyl-carrier-protein] dehydratase